MEVQVQQLQRVLVLEPLVAVPVALRAQLAAGMAVPLGMQIQCSKPELPV